MDKIELEQVMEEEVKVSPEVTSGDGLTLYLRKIRKYPILSQEDEYDYIQRWQDNRDSLALDKVVNSHMRLVAKIASIYLGYGLPYEDLISEGAMGIMKAVDRFDIKLGHRFSTYAGWWIRAAIKEYILKNWSMVKLGTTAAQKKLFFQLRKLKNELRVDEGLPDDYLDQIAKELDVPKREVADMNQRMSGTDFSLNTRVSESEGGAEWQDWLEDERENQETMVINSDDRRKKNNLLKYALECLSEREYKIFTLRNLTEQPPTLATIAVEYGLSRERVRQIESAAFGKVKRAMQSKAAELRIPVP